MGNKLVLVVDEEMGYEWIYINDELKQTGEPIDGDQWLKILKNYGNITFVEKYYLTEDFGVKVDYNYKKIPQNFREFVCEDLQLVY